MQCVELTLGSVTLSNIGLALKISLKQNGLFIENPAHLIWIQLFLSSCPQLSVCTRRSYLKAYVYATIDAVTSKTVVYSTQVSR